MRNNAILMGLLFVILGCSQQAGQVIIMDLPGFPIVFELDPGETFHLRRAFGTKIVEKDIKLIGYKCFKETNLWFPDSLPQENYFKAEVKLEVSGKPVTILRRPYQFPLEFDGLRIQVEAIKAWDTSAQVDNLKGMQKEIRLSVCIEGESWGPPSFRFPIRDYLWRSSSYSNSWGALVPFNHVYYHHGEDLAAIPDKLPVQAVFDGTVISSAYPDGDGKSNSVTIVGENGFGHRIAHMNTESILPSAALGKLVKAGQVIGKTGETWNGYKSQRTGPHMHVEFLYDSTKINPYPYLMEAYFREYPDKVLAVAGGYRFLKKGESILLDGSRSLARPGEEINSLIWITNQGDTIQNPTLELKYDQPGLYSETLIAKTKNGFEDIDFLQVVVYDEKVEGKEIICRHAHYSPVRNIQPGDSVLFWDRLVNTPNDVFIDFGDGTEQQIIDDEIYHVYDTSGRYTVTLSTRGIEDQPATIKLAVIVGTE